MVETSAGLLAYRPRTTVGKDSLAEQAGFEPSVSLYEMRPLRDAPIPGRWTQRERY